LQGKAAASFGRGDCRHHVASSPKAASLPLAAFDPPSRGGLRPNHGDLPSRGRLRAYLLAAVLFLLAFFAFVSAPARAEEVIERFASEITVRPDGVLLVSETIVVRAEGDIIKRGIVRDFPLTFEDEGGRVRRVGFRLLGVTRDARPEPYFTERRGEYLRIYTGEEDVFLNRGSHAYVLTYEAERQLRWLDGKPELNWNVTGNQSDFPIEAAIARVNLPNDAAPVRWTAYTGAYGARETDWGGEFGDGALVVRTTRALAPREGLTVIAEIPAGLVTPPDAADEARYFLLDYGAWIIGGAGLVVVLGYYLLAWSFVGRDPKGGVIIPRFHPPSGVSPALAGYIHDWGFGGNAWKAFTAAALSLAVRGLLVFDDETKGTLVLERTDAAADMNALSAEERSLLYWVEGKGGRVEIDKANGKAVAEAGDKFKRSVVSESGGRHFRRNIAYFVVGVVLSLAVVGAIVVFGALAEEEVAILAGLLFVGVFAGIFLVPVITTIFRRPTMSQFFGSVLTLVVMLYFIFQFAWDFLGGAFEGGSASSTILSALRDHALPFALVLVLPLLNGLFFYLLRAPTPEGRPVMDEIEGLRLYMETAESGRLNIAREPDLTTERFEAMLPYAVALGVERPWANAFAAALARAHPGDSDPMSHYHSRWNRGRVWSSDNFGRSIVSSVAGATGALAASVPRSSSGSSGFSGGGGSGRGGGGGGVGGW
jgi:hypothetical protein